MVNWQARLSGVVFALVIMVSMMVVVGGLLTDAYYGGVDNIVAVVVSLIFTAVIAPTVKWFLLGGGDL